MKQCRKADLAPDVLVKLRKQLTFTDRNGKQTFAAYVENNEFIRVPKFFHIPSDPRIVGTTFVPACVAGAEMHFAMYGEAEELRPLQAEALAILLERLERATVLAPQGAVLCLPCGFGKTRTAILAIQRLGVKALVLASHSHLLQQFSKEAQRITQGLVVAKLPKSPETPLPEDAHIIFGTLQSVYCRKYPSRYWASIGLVVVDEAHHLAAPTFCQALCKLPVSRVLALTATPERKDGREDLIYYLAGDTAFRAYRAKDSTVTIKFIKHLGVFGATLNHRYESVGERMQMLVELSECSERNAVLVRKIQKLAQSRRGILVLCKLVHHLHVLGDMCSAGTDAIKDYGYFTGQEKQAERELAATRQVIFATFDMAKEGLDIPRLDTLVLASPAESTIQCMGRVLREVPGKLRPLIIDVYDECVAFRGELWSRIRQFGETGASILGL